MVSVAGDVDAADGCACVGESDGSISFCEEVFICSEEGRGG